MHTTITSRHFDAGEEMKSYAGEKLEKLEQFSTKIEEVHVIFSLEKVDHITEIVLIGKNTRISSRERDRDLRASFDICLKNIEKQLKKFRARTKDKRDRRRREKIAVMEGL